MRRWRLYIGDQTNVIAFTQIERSNVFAKLDRTLALFLSGAFTIKFMSIEYLILYVFFVFLFTRKEMIQLFAKEEAVREA